MTKPNLKPRPFCGGTDLETALEGGERAGTEVGTPVEESRPLAESGSSPQLATPDLARIRREVVEAFVRRLRDACYLHDGVDGKTRTALPERRLLEIRDEWLAEREASDEA